ncbi:MAG: hypothetical protein LBR94_04205 [Desulfovibrio sp.]|jgi:hypothetical protein|nr:hypothetical protein [Desulfovibrio sp.]
MNLLVFTMIAGTLGYLLFRRRKPAPDDVPPMPLRRARESRGFSVREYGFFRIFYTESGPHAVRRAPGDDGDCPMRIEDLARQLLAAHRIFCDVARFRSPLESPYYPGRRYIDVYLFNKRMMGGGRGRSMTLPLVPADDGYDPGATASCLHIRNDLDITRNVTPAHEYFHQIQDGMTMLKNDWYFEGMARWAGEALEIQHFNPRRVPDAGTVDYSQLPLSAQFPYIPEYPGNGPPDIFYDGDQIKKILSATYDAALFLWIPLANYSPDDAITLPGDDPVLHQKYSTGEAVVSKHMMRGARIMRTILEEFGNIEHVIYRENNYRGGWSNANRRNPRNNRYMLEAVRKTAERLLP